MSPPPATAQRTLHVRCTTWDQVSTFTSRKLRRGKLLSMKVPFAAEVNAAMTLGLELPNGLVIAIDGVVRKASAIVGETSGKTWIEVELAGFTEEVMARIRAMAAGAAPAPAPQPAPESFAAGSAPVAPRRTVTSIGVDTLPADERELFQHLTAELRRMRQLAVHEVLDLSVTAGPEEVRDGWMQRIRLHHPDLVARRSSPAISHLAEELTILCNRAYDRLRAALVAEGRASTAGPTLAAPPGWLVGFDDISSGGTTPLPRITGAHAPITATGSAQMPAVQPPPSVIVSADATGSGGTSDRRGPKYATIPPINAASPQPPPAVQGGEAFEMRARTMLGQGDAETAREVLAAALCVYPRSKPLRSLYFVASALNALQSGETMLAMSQLETALAHHEQCTEAAAMLEHMRKHEQADLETLKGLFK